MSVFEAYQAATGAGKPAAPAAPAAPAPAPTLLQRAAGALGIGSMAPTTDPAAPTPLTPAPQAPPVAQAPVSTPRATPTTPAAPQSVYAQFEASQGKAPALPTAPAAPVLPAIQPAVSSKLAATSTPPAGGADKGMQVSPYFAATDSKGDSFGFSDQLDPSGVPYFAYRAPGDTSTTTDLTRVDVSGFDPRVAQPLTASTFLTPRAVANRATLKASMGGTYSDELDHVISLELAGSNNQANLQIEPDIPGTNNTATDPLENTLAKNVVTGKMSLFQAQTALAQAKGKATPFTGAAPAKTPSLLGDVGADFNAIKGTYGDLAQKVGGVFSDFLGTPEQTNPQGLKNLNAASAKLDSILSTLGPSGDALTAQYRDLQNTQVDTTSQASVDAYNAKVNAFNDALQSYQFKGGEAPKLVDDYNTAVQAYNGSTSQGSGAIGAFDSAADATPVRSLANLAPYSAPDGGSVALEAASKSLNDGIQQAADKLSTSEGDLINVWNTAMAGKPVSSDQITQGRLDTSDAALGLVNGVFSGFLSFLGGAQTVSGVGYVASKVNDLFTALSGGASKVAVDTLNAMPSSVLSNEQKQEAQPLVSDIAGLVAQIIAGEKGAELLEGGAPKKSGGEPDTSTTAPKPPDGGAGNPPGDIPPPAPVAQLRALIQKTQDLVSKIKINPATLTPENEPQTTPLQAHAATAEAAGTTHTPLPEDAAAGKELPEAIEQYHSEDMAKPKQGLANITEARSLISTLEGELKSAHPSPELRTDAQNTMQAHLDALKDYVTKNKAYERYWSGTVPGDNISRAERAASDPTANQTGKYVERYSGDVLDAIEKGHDVPQNVIDQRPEFGQAVEDKNEEEMAREAVYAPLDGVQYHKGDFGPANMPIAATAAAFRAYFPDAKERELVFGSRFTDREGKPVNGYYDPGNGFRNPVVAVVAEHGLVRDKVFYEEAFHKFWRETLTEAERQEMTKNVAASKLTAVGRRILSEKYPADKVVSEYIAHDFAKWEKTRVAEIAGNATWYQKIHNMVLNIMRRLNGLEGAYKRLAAGDTTFHKPARLFTGEEGVEYHRDDPEDEKTTDQKLEELQAMHQIYQDAIATHPARDLQKYVSNATGRLPEVTGKDTMKSVSGSGKTVKTGEFNKHGDVLAQEAGYQNEDHANHALNDLQELKAQDKEVLGRIRELKAQKAAEKQEKFSAMAKPLEGRSNPPVSVSKGAPRSGTASDFADILEKAAQRGTSLSRFLHQADRVYDANDPATRLGLIQVYKKLFQKKTPITPEEVAQAMHIFEVQRERIEAAKEKISSRLLSPTGRVRETPAELRERAQSGRQSEQREKSYQTSDQHTTNKVELAVKGRTVDQRVRSAIQNSESLKTKIINRGQEAYNAGRGLPNSDLRIIRDQYQAGKKSFSEIADATSNPLKAATFLTKLNDYYDYRLAADRESGGQTSRIENYMPQTWDLSNPQDEARFNELAKQKGIQQYRGFRAQPKLFESYAEGEAAGFTPKNKNILEDVRVDYERASGTIAQQALKTGLNQAAPRMVSVSGYGKTDEGKPFVNSNLPGLEGMSYHPTIGRLLGGYEPLRGVDFIKLVQKSGADAALEQTGVASMIDKTIAMAKSIPANAKEAGLTGVLGSMYDHVSSPMKQVLWNWSGFHSLNITLSHMGASLTHPLTGIKGVVQSVGSAMSERVYDATVNHYKNLMVGKDAKGAPVSVFDWAVTSGAYEPRGLPVTGLHRLNLLASGKRIIFDREIPVLQLNLAEQAARKGIVADSPQGIAVGKEIRTITGEINAKTMNLNPNTIKMASRAFLAPGFTFSKYKTLLDAVTKFGQENGAAGNLARTAVIGKSAIIGVAATLGTLLATGKFPNLQQILMNFTLNPSTQTNLTNPKGETLDVTYPKTFLSEGASAILNPVAYGNARLNPLIADILKLYTNQDYNGFPIVDPNTPQSAALQIAQNIGAGHLPIGAQAIVNTLMGKQNWPSAALQIGGLNTKVDPSNPTAMSNRAIADAKNSIGAIAPDDPNRQEKMQDIFNSLTEAQRVSLKYQMLLAGIKTTGIYTADIGQTYFELQQQGQTDPAGAQAAYEELTPVEQSEYQKFKAAQKATATKNAEKNILSTYESIRKQGQTDPAGAQAAYDALSPADQKAYQLLKKKGTQ